MINTSTYLFAQGGAGAYTFKYILKPKYKTRLHFPFKQSAGLQEYIQKKDSIIQNKYDSIQNNIQKSENIYNSYKEKNSDAFQPFPIDNMTKYFVLEQKLQNENIRLKEDADNAISNEKNAKINDAKDRNNELKRQIPNYVRDFFDILFLGTGYNRNFNMSDIIYDDDTLLKYDIGYKPAYWRLDTSNRNFTLFSDMDDLIGIRDIDFVKRNDLLPGAIFLKFNHSIKTFDIDDTSKNPPKITPANNTLLPTYKRKWNFTNNVSDDDHDGDNHKKYLKFKYGIDILYKKGSFTRKGYNTVQSPITFTKTSTSPALIHSKVNSTAFTITSFPLGIPGIFTGTVSTTNSETKGAQSDATKSETQTFAKNTVISQTQITQNEMTPYNIVGIGSTTLSHPALKCYILNKINGTDTMMMVPWFRRHVAVHNKKNGLKLMNNNNDKDSLEFKEEIIARDIYKDTFYFVIPNNYNTQASKNSNYNKFNLEFNTKYFIPVSITFQEIGFSFHKPIILQSNFISAGMAYGWAHGKTTFFKNDNNTQKNFYLGAGFVGSLSAASDTSKANKGNMVPALSLGVHIGVAISSIQILAAGGYGFAFEDTQTQWGRKGEPWIGFGIGLNLFTLTIPTIASAAGGK